MPAPFLIRHWGLHQGRTGKTSKESRAQTGPSPSSPHDHPGPSNDHQAQCPSCQLKQHWLTWCATTRAQCMQSPAEKQKEVNRGRRASELRAVTGRLTLTLCFSLAADLSYQAEQENSTFLINSMEERRGKKKKEKPSNSLSQGLSPCSELATNSISKHNLSLGPWLGLLTGFVNSFV